MSEEYDADGNRLPHRARQSGVLPTPEFGQIPEGRQQNRPATRIEREYWRHFQTLRDHPGHWAKVALFKIGSELAPAMTRKRSMQLATREKETLKAHLRREFPLEQWKVSIRTTAGTWGDREIWLLYIGPWTEEERLADERERKTKMQWRMDIAAKRKAAREAAARAQIIEMQSQRGGGRRR